LAYKPLHPAPAPAPLKPAAALTLTDWPTLIALGVAVTVTANDIYGNSIRNRQRAKKTIRERFIAFLLKYEWGRYGHNQEDADLFLLVVAVNIINDLYVRTF
jgi:hypothetical protein